LLALSLRNAIVEDMTLSARAMITRERDTMTVSILPRLPVSTAGNWRMKMWREWSGSAENNTCDAD
jgi:hypothetical protein